jgi:hypothetical protein
LLQFFSFYPVAIFAVVLLCLYCVGQFAVRQSGNSARPWVLRFAYLLVEFLPATEV